MTTQLFQAYPLDYLAEDLNVHELSGDEIRVHRFVLEGWLQREGVDEGKPLLVHVTSHDGNNRVCCVGAPHFQERGQVYIPQWIMENVGLEMGSNVTLEPITENMPYASMIYLKPMDTAIYHTDIRECFERALDMFHVIEVGTMLTVEIEALGGYKVQAYVDRVEPGYVARLGGEVGVEFMEPEGGVPEFVVPATPEPVAVPTEPVAVPTELVAVPAEPAPDYNKIREEVRASWLKKYKK